MNEYTVFLSQRAAEDLEEIVDYIASGLQAPDTAMGLLRRLKKAVSSLETMPERHGLVSDPYLAAKGIRLLPESGYLIFYRVNQAQAAVTVIRVLYGKREWEALL